MTTVNEGLGSLGMVILLLSLAVVGTATNILVVLVVFVNRVKSGVIEMFICNTAIFDILLSAVVIPLKVNQGIQGHSHVYPGGKCQNRSSYITFTMLLGRLYEKDVFVQLSQMFAET